MLLLSRFAASRARLADSVLVWQPLGTSAFSGEVELAGPLKFINLDYTRTQLSEVNHYGVSADLMKKGRKEGKKMKKGAGIQERPP